MPRSEYERSLIMLRPLATGYSGHVRSERRAHSASLRFAVRAPGEAALQAVLIGERRGEYYAAPLGTLRPETAEQYRLSADLDPRDVAGRPLDAYRLVAVVRIGASACELALSGNLKGTFAVNWSLARSAVCGLFRPDDAKAEAVRPEIRIDVKAIAPGPETPPEDGIPDASPANETAARQDAASEAEESEAERPEPEETLAETSAEALTAADMLGLDPDAAWPDDLENARALFFTHPPFAPFQAEGYVFADAPLPPETGYTHCAIGLKACEGKPISVCYALPGTFAPEPPAGLEGYCWRGAGASGWWAVFLDAETGEELPCP